MQSNCVYVCVRGRENNPTNHDLFYKQIYIWIPFSKYHKITTLCFKLWCENALNFELHLLGRVSLFDGLWIGKAGLLSTFLFVHRCETVRSTATSASSDGLWTHEHIGAAAGGAAVISCVIYWERYGVGAEITHSLLSFSTLANWFSTMPSNQVTWLLFLIKAI